MKHLFTSVIFLLCLLSALPSNGQGENNTWCFGQRVGFDFNSTPPVFFQHNMKVNEGGTSVCDAAGNLLFYSSGSNNWDRNGNLMPNGTGLLGNGPLAFGVNIGSSMRGVAIAKSPSNPQQYYMITTDANEDPDHNAYYSVIDMSLNSGLGDVVPGLKNIVLDTNVNEGVVVQKASTCGDYWIILHRGPDSHLSYKLDASGINPIPVASNGIYWPVARTKFNEAGTLSISGFPDMELLSFDKTTGAFSLLGMLYNGFLAGGRSAIFSPDGTKLYAGEGSLIQYDLSLLPNITAVQNSKTTIDTGNFIDLRQGPDHKIYTLRYAAGRLGCIQDPNAPGSACLYDRNAFVLPAYSPLNYTELGNPVIVHTPDTFARLVTDTTICQLPQITLSAAGQHQSYLWNTGSTSAQATIQEGGVYWVYGRDPCALSIDSFRIRFTRFDTVLPSDTAICAGDELKLDATTDGASYRWQDGSSGATFTVSDKGTYYVKTIVAPCEQTDTIRVRVIVPYARILEEDTIVCAGTRLVLHAELYPGGSYWWNNGSTTPVVHTDSAGTYVFKGTNACGTFSDSIQVTAQYCNCIAYAPNAFSPNGDGRNDLFVIELHCPSATAYSHTIYNRYGQKVFESKQPGEFWNGMFNGNSCNAGTYFYYLEYKNGTEKIKKKGDLVVVR